MYSFKHALTQDVVYAGVLERRRRQHHGAAGRGLEELYTGHVDDVVELIAYHFGRGQVWDKAVTYLRQAAAKAQGEVGSPRGAGLARRGAGGAPPPARDAGDSGARHRCAPRAAWLALPARRVREDAGLPAGSRDHGQGDLRFPPARADLHPYRRILSPDWSVRRSANAGRAALALGNKLQDVPLQLYAGQYLGLACHALGDYRRAADLLRAVAQSPEPEWRTGAFAAWCGSWDAYQAITLAWLARCLAERGEFEEGVDAGRRAVALAEGLEQPVQPARPPASGWGTSASSGGISTRRAPCSSAPAPSPAKRISHCSVRRPPGSWAAPISWPGGSTRA